MILHIAFERYWLRFRCETTRACTHTHTARQCWFNTNKQHSVGKFWSYYLPVLCCLLLNILHFIVDMFDTDILSTFTTSFSLSLSSLFVVAVVCSRSPSFVVVHHLQQVFPSMQRILHISPAILLRKCVLMVLRTAVNSLILISKTISYFNAIFDWKLNFYSAQCMMRKYIHCTMHEGLLFLIHKKKRIQLARCYLCTTAHTHTGKVGDTFFGPPTTRSSRTFSTSSRNTVQIETPIIIDDAQNRFESHSDRRTFCAIGISKFIKILRFPQACVCVRACRRVYVCNVPLVYIRMWVNRKNYMIFELFFFSFFNNTGQSERGRAREEESEEKNALQ